jgi:hypothetical protein
MNIIILKLTVYLFDNSFESFFNFILRQHVKKHNLSVYLSALLIPDVLWF